MYEGLETNLIREVFDLKIESLSDLKLQPELQLLAHASGNLMRASNAKNGWDNRSTLCVQQRGVLLLVELIACFWSNSQRLGQLSQVVRFFFGIQFDRH